MKRNKLEIICKVVLAIGFFIALSVAGQSDAEIQKNVIRMSNPQFYSTMLLSIVMMAGAGLGIIHTYNKR